MLEDLTLEKSVFNVSKHTIEYLTGKVSSYKSKRTKASKCNNCPILSLSIKEEVLENTSVKNYCENFCNREDKELQYVFTQNIRRFKNFKIKPSISNTILKSKKSLKFIKSELSLTKCRFSAMQIKQALLYYSICNSKGIISGIEKKKLAEALGCTVKTIENNNNVFLQHNLFTIKRDCAGSVYVKINNYEDQFKKKKKNNTEINTEFNDEVYMELAKDLKYKFDYNSNEEEVEELNKKDKKKKGYMPFVGSIFKTILKSDELKVNELRFLLRTLSKFDYNYKKKHKTNFSFMDIKEFLATNFHTLKSLKSLANVINNVFKDLIKVHIVKNDEIKIDLVDKVHGKFVKDNHLSEYMTSFRKLQYEKDYMLPSRKYMRYYRTEYEIEVANEILRNLGELAIEYGYDLVKEQLTNLSEELGTIDNFGGFIRDKIKRYIKINRAYLKLI